ncbi:MAG TPA: hypothetical protein VEY09_05610 [Pyrinomonadaceae bacterium]|nr:hypothetical protein [Pyrinomonadaceae bacterium]
MHHDFLLAGRRVRLWQRTGEGYGHVLLKALGYAMFVGEYPNLEIERRVGLRYKPDLVALAGGGGPAAAVPGARFLFWGECGLVTMRKVAWLLKHGDIERLALFKLGAAAEPLARELRQATAARYREGNRLLIFNFAADVAERASDHVIERVPEGWYTTFVV